MGLFDSNSNGGRSRLVNNSSIVWVDDSFAKVSDIQEFIVQERDAKDEKEIPYMTTSIKADETVKMGIVTDVKQELRKANALKINYSTRKGTY